jgi:hypothetical protein
MEHCLDTIFKVNSCVYFLSLFVYFLFLLESTKESESTKWVIHLQGGGECASKDSCYSELSSNLGSSKYFDPSMSLWFLNYDNPSANPDFAYANHVHVPYCSGDLHSGTVRHPTKETWGLYFSGHLVFEAIVSTGCVSSLSRCLLLFILFSALNFLSFFVSLCISFLSFFFSID